MTKFKTTPLFSWLTAIMLTATILASCKSSDPDEITKAPTITFENTTDIYIVKVGKDITIKPIVENDNGAMYSWTADGKILGSDKILTHSWSETGQVFVTFKVVTDYGSAEKEIRIDIAQLVAPRITLSVPEGGFMTIVNQQLNLTPQVDNPDQATFKWSVDNKEVATSKDFVFSSAKKGDYKLRFKTVNEDGADSIEFDVAVKDPADMPFSWDFEYTTYNVAKGRTIRLLPYGVKNAFDATYIWTVNGSQVQSGSKLPYVFTAETEGSYAVTVTMKNSHNTVSKSLTIKVCPPEGTYKRQASASSAQNFDKVYEIITAPGQFINEGYTATTMEQAIIYAQNQLKKNGFVSLGGFGGYIVLGFDHSIDNDGGYNFQVMGNSFEGSSEPGIVSVMQDENGDGLPNDTWYELKGSESNKAETIADYEITYYRPRYPKMPVSWRDNKGKSGVIDYLDAYHRQDYYYPAWVKADFYTLRGTCLKSRSVEVNPGFWSNDTFDWGYADNFSPIDRLTNSDNHDAGVNANHFKIGDAVTFDGKPANLKYIDFIKIHTGVNAKAGWLGEVSTEVFGARDFNLIKK